MMIEMSTSVKQSTDQVSCSLDDEVVILSLESSLYFGLDEVAACIWDAMREPAKPSDICQKVMDRFDVGEERCLADVFDFLEKLAEASLIQTHLEK
jgi:Coenzyme PQQ synthesis protein D (PqqD)